MGLVSGMAPIEIEIIILAGSILASVGLYLLNAWTDRRRQKEAFAERAAIKSLSPLLVEIHSLEKACELLGSYPENAKSLRPFFDPDVFQDRVSDAFIFLANTSFEQNALNLLMFLYHANGLLDRLEELEDPPVENLISLASAMLEVVSPLREATMHAITVYRKQIGVRQDIDYPIPFEAVQAQIESTLVRMEHVVPSSELPGASEEDKKVAEEMAALWSETGDNKGEI